MRRFSHLPNGWRFLSPAVVLAAGLCAIALVGGLYGGGVLKFLELDSVDARFAVRGSRTPPRKLVLVLVTERTLDRLGAAGTFIPRSWHAKVIRRIARDRPAVIAYDYTFDTPSPAWIRDGLGDRSGDNLLVQAVADADGKVVLASDQLGPGGGPFSLGRGDAGLRALGAHAGSTEIRGQTTIRRLPFSVDGVASFPLVAADVALGKRPLDLSGSRGSAWIDFYGPPGTVRSVSFENVYQDKIQRGYFRGAVVVVGASAPSLLDLHPTATSGAQLMSGPEINADSIETAMRGFPLRSSSSLVDLGLIVALGLVVPIGNLRFGPRGSLTIALVCGAAFLIATQLAFNSGWVTSFVYPMLALALSFVGVVAARYALTSADPRFVTVETVGVVIGSEVAGYRVERLLGRGGGGTVYVSTDTALRRRVALKVLSPELTDSEEARANFLHESQLAAALDHPNVVPIYRAGEEAGYLYIAMKLVRGSLASLLRRDQSLEPRRALGLMEQVASALDAAHSIGLVHRDVTPGNILIDPPVDGVDRVYLADFGLTKHRGLVSGAGLVGTPDYVSPEQIRGDMVDARADLYSLACVFYECLTGDPPFADASEITVIGSHLSRSPAPVTSRRSDLRAAIDEPFARALAKNPDDRHGTCGDFVGAVRAACLEVAPDSFSAV